MDGATAPWPWRRAPGGPPPELASALAGHPAGALLAAIAWRRGFDTAAAVLDFLEPSLARGLRAPEEVPGVQAAGVALAQGVHETGAIALTCDATGPALVAGATVAAWAEAAGVAVRGEGAAGIPVVVHGSDVVVAGARASGARVMPALAVSGLAFYVLVAARAARRAAGRGAGPDLRGILDLVALGTIIDDCELRAENRVLAAVGLRVWRNRPRPGLRALCGAAEVEPMRAPEVRRRLGARLDAAAVHAADTARALLATSDPETARGQVATLELATAGRREYPRVDDEALCLDAEVPLHVADGLLLALSRLEPCGPGNPEPVFLARDVRVDGVRAVGDLLAPRWRLRLRQEGRTRRATAADLGGRMPALGSRVDVAYVPRLGRHGGRAGLEMVVRGLAEQTSVTPHDRA